MFNWFEHWVYSFNPKFSFIKNSQSDKKPQSKHRTFKTENPNSIYLIRALSLSLSSQVFSHYRSIFPETKQKAKGEKYQKSKRTDLEDELVLAELNGVLLSDLVILGDIWYAVKKHHVRELYWCHEMTSMCLKKCMKKKLVRFKNTKEVACLFGVCLDRLLCSPNLAEALSQRMTKPWFWETASRCYWRRRRLRQGDRLQLMRWLRVWSLSGFWIGPFLGRNYAWSAKRKLEIWRKPKIEIEKFTKWKYKWRKLFNLTLHF